MDIRTTVVVFNFHGRSADLSALVFTRLLVLAQT
jgi:hypothetical protein